MSANNAHGLCGEGVKRWDGDRGCYIVLATSYDALAAERDRLVEALRLATCELESIAAWQMTGAADKVRDNVLRIMLAALSGGRT